MADMQGFDPDQHQSEGREYGALKQGWYTVRITESDWRETAAGDGEYLKLRMEVCEGPRSGAVLFDNLNLRNRSEKASAIAKETLARICRATGLSGQLGDSTQLHNVPIQAFVKVRTWNGEEQNEVKGYKPVLKQFQGHSPDRVRGEGGGPGGGGGRSDPWL